MINDEWRDELLSKINIEQVVGEYVNLQKRGSNYMACCPFHHEKTPSFSVSPDKQIFKCFGCGKGGNVINFIMNIENLSYPEACQFLADKIGMQLPEFNISTDFEEKKKLRSRIYEINKCAARFFHESLFSSSGKEALDYFTLKRGLSKNTIIAFGLGYADAKWDSLTGYLQSKGYMISDIEKAGLCKVRDNGKVFDMFRNRPIMPIIDVYSNVIGFGGRALSPDDNPKYLNTSETLVFKKKLNLYHLNSVKKLHDLKYIILAEGYMDVIALTSYGFSNCVATLGTALTAQQAKLMTRYTKKVIVSYDGDSAGQEASLKAVDILNDAGIDARVAVIPGGQDPDEFLKSAGPEAYRKLLNDSMGRIEYKFQTERLKVDMDSDDGKEAFLKAAVDILKVETSPIVQEKYIRMLSNETGYSERSLKEEMGIEKSLKVWNDKESKRNSVQKSSGNDAAERYLLLRIMEEPGVVNVLSELSITDEDFSEPVYGRIYNIIKRLVAASHNVSYSVVLSELENDDDRSVASGLFSSELASIDPDGNNTDQFFIGCVKLIRKKSLERYRDSLIAGYRNLTQEEKNVVGRKISELAAEINKCK